jgi:predicted enzyme related to lactoylglutathione lyase
MPNLERVDVVWYPVTDWDRAKRFYKDILALKPAFGMDEMGWLEFEVGSAPTHLAISRTEPGQSTAAAGGGVAVIAVKDIEGVRADLVGKGVRCDDVQVIPNVVKLCSFFDPDGNRIQLAQSLGS